MIRYSVIEKGNPREIVLLRGTGCRWRRCTFCDYHLDSSRNEEENHALNREVLKGVTGQHHRLEVINSGSFPELDIRTQDDILALCRDKRIETLHTECHYMYQNKIPALRERFAAAGTELKIKIGVETFDFAFRENVLKKGIPERDPAKIAENFNECCLLFGLSGQTEESMQRDIEIGLAHFERVCVNLMEKNSTSVLPDREVIHCFAERILPRYQNDSRLDILMHNTDFGIGGTSDE